MGFWDWLTGWLEWLGLKNKQGKLLLLGLDNAGKTTLLMCLKTGNFQQFEQTKSYHVENLTIEGINFAAYDLGGHIIARESWGDYFINANAVVFIVDAADTARFPIVKKQLDDLLQDENLKNVPFLILVNKVDLENAVSQEVLASELGLYNMTPADATAVPPGQRPFRLFMCSVYKKAGYAKAFKWLAKFI